MTRPALFEAARRLSGWLRRARGARQAAARKGEGTKFRNRFQALKPVKGDNREHHA